MHCGRDKLLIKAAKVLVYNGEFVSSVVGLLCSPRP